METICDRIFIESRYIKNEPNEWYGKLYLNNEKDEKKTDEIIRANEQNIFKDEVSGLPLKKERKLMWTGVAYGYDESMKEWKAKYQGSAVMRGSDNFCDRDSWSKENLNKKGELLDKKKDKIYVIKNYGKTDNACWELYTAKELLDIMGQSAGTIPRLSFACTSKYSNKYSGQDAIPGYFKPSEVLNGADGKYWMYRVSATPDEALKECSFNSGHLVTIETKDQLENIEKMLRDPTNKMKPLSSEHRLWTGGYIEVPKDENLVKWSGVNPVKEDDTRWTSPEFKALFRNFDDTKMNDALANMKTTISRSERKEKDCTDWNRLYVGIEYMAEPITRTGLTIINPNGVTGEELSLFVLCKQNI